MPRSLFGDKVEAITWKWVLIYLLPDLIVKIESYKNSLYA